MDPWVHMLEVPAQTLQTTSFVPEINIICSSGNGSAFWQQCLFVFLRILQFLWSAVHVGSPINCMPLHYHLTEENFEVTIWEFDNGDGDKSSRNNDNNNSSSSSRTCKGQKSNLGKGNHSVIYATPQFFQDSGPNTEVHCTSCTFFKIMLVRVALRRFLIRITGSGVETGSTRHVGH
jgi:hypothetical protein